MNRRGSGNGAVFSLFAVACCEMAGFAMLAPFVTLRAVELGAPPQQATILLASYSLALLCALPLWGAVSDRIGRRRTLLVCLLASAGTSWALALAESSLAMIVVRLVAGGFAGIVPVIQALADDWREPSARARGIGAVAAAMAGGFVIGPALGGVIVRGGLDDGAFATIALLSAALSVAAAVLVAVLPVFREPAVMPAQMRRHSDLAHWRVIVWIWRPDTRWLVVVAMSGSFAFAMMESVLAIHATQVRGWNPAEIGAAMAAAAIVAIAAQLCLAERLRRLWGERALILQAVAAHALGLVLIGVGDSLAAVLGLLAIAYAFAIGDPTVIAETARRLPKDLSGTGIGVVHMSANVGRIVGPIMGGASYAALGPPAPFLAGAALLAGVLLAVWPISKQPIGSMPGA